MKLSVDTRQFEIDVEYRGETGHFEIEPLNPQEVDKLLKKFRKGKKDFDLLGFKIAKLQQTFKSWDLEDEDGVPIPCTPENIKTVYLTHPALLNRASEKADKLYTDAEAEEDAELGFF